MGERCIRPGPRFPPRPADMEIGAPVDSKVTAPLPGGAEQATHETAVRCHAIAAWWRHAAAGECTVEQAGQATVLLLGAIVGSRP